MIAIALTAVLCGTPAAPGASDPKPPAQKPAEKAHRVKVLVTENGFEPSQIEAKAGEKLVLEVTRKTDATCAKRIVVPSQNIDVEMPLDKAIEVAVDASKAGKIPFGCQMGQMISGAIVVK